MLHGDLKALKYAFIHPLNQNEEINFVKQANKTYITK